MSREEQNDRVALEALQVAKQAAREGREAEASKARAHALALAKSDSVKHAAKHSISATVRRSIKR